MKALPMLDHVALWYVRIFAVLWFADIFTAIWHELVNSHNLLLTNPLILHLVLLLIASAILVGVWLPHVKSLRICFGLGSAFMFLEAVYSTGWALLNAKRTDDLFCFLLNMTFLLFTFATLVWVSIRPPKNSKNFDNGSPENHPLPQSF